MWLVTRFLLQPLVTARFETLLKALTSMVADFSVCGDVVAALLVIVMENEMFVLPDASGASGAFSVTSYLRTGVPGPAAVEPEARAPDEGLIGLRPDSLLQAADRTSMPRIERARVFK